MQSEVDCNSDKSATVQVATFLSIPPLQSAMTGRAADNFDTPWCEVITDNSDNNDPELYLSNT